MRTGFSYPSIIKSRFFSSDVIAGSTTRKKAQNFLLGLGTGTMANTLAQGKHEVMISRCTLLCHDIFLLVLFEKKKS
jgi:hypothetical protein